MTDAAARQLDENDRRTFGYHVWVFGERTWFARQSDARRYARRAHQYCPAEFIEMREVATGQMVA